MPNSKGTQKFWPGAQCAAKDAKDTASKKGIKQAEQTSNMIKAHNHFGQQTKMLLD